jgi:hypothetical protein
MSCEHLVCAQCSGPVAEGRCAVCRAGKERVHHQYVNPSSILVLALTALLLAFVALAGQLAG